MLLFCPMDLARVKKGSVELVDDAARAGTKIHVTKHGDIKFDSVIGCLTNRSHTSNISPPICRPISLLPSIRNPRPFILPSVCSRYSHHARTFLETFVYNNHSVELKQAR